MAESKHYVVIEGLGSGTSDYTIQATGQIEKVPDKIGGVSVSVNSGDRIDGSTVTGTVAGGADGYRIYGGIKSIDVQHPDRVQIHAGELASDDVTSPDECEVTIRAERVEFVSGQGAGEGELELEILHNIHGAQSQVTQVNLPTGSTRNIGVSIDNIKVPRGGTENKRLTTKVTDREPGSDWFAGGPDENSNSMDLTLECGQTQEVSQNVTIDSDRGNPGEVKVYYTIGDLSG